MSHKRTGSQVVMPIRQEPSPPRHQEELKYYDDLGTLTEPKPDVHGEQSGSLNYGERLYQKGMRRKEELAKHIETL